MVKKKTKRRAPPLKLKIVPKAKPVKSQKIPVSLASAKDIVRSVEREERIKMEKKERLAQQLKEIRKFGSGVVDRAVAIGQKRTISRKVLKKEPRVTIVLKEREALPDRSRFFTGEVGEAQRALFFK